VVVMLGIVGMHQLSVGHDLATGQASSHEHAETVGHAQNAPLAQDGEHLAAMAHLDHQAEPAPGANPGAGLAGENCLTCGDHEMALESCLLALTLLVLGWLLLPPRLRLLPPFLRPRVAAVLVRPAYLRLVPALTLTELSLRRT
jgi:hypothetical protein